MIKTPVTGLARCGKGVYVDMMLLTNSDHFDTEAGRNGKRLVFRLEVHEVLMKLKCLIVKIMANAMQSHC